MIGTLCLEVWWKIEDRTLYVMMTASSLALLEVLQEKIIEHKLT